MILEVACFNIQSCLIAQEAGAQRIEFCSDYKSGGITPPEKEITEVRKKIKIPLHIIIRPRSGNFIYSAEEILLMKKQILFCKQNGIDGVVFGALNSNKEIDTAACQLHSELSHPMSINFHRAFDLCSDPEKSLETLILLKFNRVLTSGGKSNALEGAENLTRMQKKYGSRIIIMPGGGVRSENIPFLLKTGCKEFHSSAITGNGELPGKAEIRQLLANMNAVR
jgi:copper homeostasis protein